jgi:ribose/xylose/arabinose/galactoside ABC-type transport system permease subunit
MAKKNFPLRLARILRPRAQKLILFGVIVVIGLVTSLINPNFFKIRNFFTILQQIAVLGIVAMAMLTLMISRTIDLSLGALIGLCGGVLCKMMMAGMSIYYGVLVVFLISLGAGLLNGIVVTKSKSEPLIITLGMSYFYNGIALVITGGSFLSLKGHLEWLGSGKIAGLPVSVLVLAVLMLIIHFILKYTKYGRRLHIIGANEELAYLSGINADNYKIINYVTGGLLTGIAALVLTARLGNILAGSGNGYEFRALSAAIIGGVTFEGAKGDVPGVFLGVILLGIISNAMNVLGVSAFYQTAVLGIIIVAAVSASNINKTKRNKI